MEKRIVILLFSLLFLSACQGNQGTQENKEFQENKGDNMQIKSNAFQSGKDIPSKYTCDGKNISPGLIIINAPKQTKSFALIMEDPDAPRGNFLHWTLWNIQPKTTEIKEGEAPGTPGKNDFGKLSYGGPCPPSGIHRYVFRAYALDTTLNLKAGASRQELETMMKSHILESAELIGRYSRVA